MSSNEDAVLSTKEDVISFLEKLSNYYEIPSPNVLIMPQHPNYLAYFSVDVWTIFVSLPTSEKEVRHEFFHYCIALIKKTEELEERLASVFGSIEEEGLEQINDVQEIK